MISPRVVSFPQMRSLYPKCAITMTLAESSPVVSAEFGACLSCVAWNDSVHSCLPLTIAVNGDKVEFEVKHMDMFDITQVLHETAAEIRRADELVGDFREVHNMPSDR